MADKKPVFKILKNKFTQIVSRSLATEQASANDPWRLTIFLSRLSETIGTRNDQKSFSIYSGTKLFIIYEETSRPQVQNMFQKALPHLPSM